MARQELCYIGPTVEGIDVSHHQGQIDWDAVASSGVRYVFIRSGDGVNVDRRFVENWREAGRVGLRRGVYHYFRPRHDGVQQAQIVSAAIREAGGFASGDLPVAIDLETMDDQTEDKLVAEAVAFQREIERRTRRRPMVYSGAFWQSLALRRPDLAGALSKYPLWTTGYIPRSRWGDREATACARVANGFPDWTIWQYTSSGEVPGIRTRVDMNVFKGSESALAAFARTSKKLPWGWLALGAVALAGTGYGVYRVRGGRKPAWLPV